MPDEYIKRSDAKNAYKASRSKDNHRTTEGSLVHIQEHNHILHIIDKLPAADVVEVVHGEWKDKCVRDWHCSRCNYDIQKIRHYDGYVYDDLPNFCPNCGAKMDGERRCEE